MCCRRSFYTAEGVSPRLLSSSIYFSHSFSHHNLYDESRVVATIARVRFNVIVILRLSTTFSSSFSSFARKQEKNE